MSRLLKLVAILLMIAAPAVGVWGASSLAAFVGGPLWVAAAAGMLLFPLGPLLWEGYARYRAARMQPSRARILTWSDRLILRTLLLNALFLGVLLSVRPAQLFTALSARGDWMLDAREFAYEEQARATLFTMADGPAPTGTADDEAPDTDEADEADEADDDDDDPRGLSNDTDAPAPTPPAVPGVSDAGLPGLVDSSVAQALEQADAGSAPSPGGTVPAVVPEPLPGPPGEIAWKLPRWPARSDLHPAVLSMPEQAKSDLRAIAAHIESRERDPYLQVKAIHDYVADRVRYDFASLDAGDYPPYEANIVNRTKLPDQKRWQLLDTPISRGEFLRQPMLSPRFHAEALTLLDPRRSHIDASGSVVVRVQNPRGRYLSASLENESGRRRRCGEATNGATITLQCPVPDAGLFRLLMFANDQPYGTYDYVGRFAVSAR